METKREAMILKNLPLVTFMVGRMSEESGGTIDREDALAYGVEGLIQAVDSYDETREFSEIVAGAIARAHPGLATTEWSKAKRRGVLIDSNQNGEGKTIASVYSVRPKPGAPVSTPLRWEEVNASLDPAAFTMDAVLERVAEEGDLYAPVLTTRQRLDKALRALR